MQKLTQAIAPADLKPRGLRLRDLIWLRWLSLGAQLAGLAAAATLADLAVPLLPALALIGLGVALNLSVLLVAPHDRPTRDLEATLQLGFDILQVSGLLFLTGGTINPFALLLIAPPTLAAAALPARNAAALALLSLVCAVALAFVYLPAPWMGGATPGLTARLSAVSAIAFGVVFFAGYAWRASREATRMALALDVAQAVLAREQRLSALGGLAAAAAHELGTPLATISIVAKEMAREATEATKEDARLLVSQAERCREILHRLTEAPETSDIVHERMSLVQVLDEIVAPHAEARVRVEALVTGPSGMTAPDVRRMPEVLHAMTSFVDNAVDFANSDVLVTARYDAGHISIEVRDDGPGFSPEVLNRLGQPYVSSRPAPEALRSGHTGMGLGFFIAKTLLEKTGAVVEFRNAAPGGALVTARWQREAIELSPLTQV